MANQKLNEVTTVPTASINNVKTFLAVMNDGSIQQMSKADMATVLGGLIKPIKCRNIIPDGQDLNTLEPNNVYSCNGESLLNAPVGLSNNYFTLFFYMGYHNFGTQILSHLWSGELYIRNKNNSQWFSWHKIPVIEV